MSIAVGSININSLVHEQHFCIFNFYVVLVVYASECTVTSHTYGKEEGLLNTPNQKDLKAQFNKDLEVTCR